MICFIGYFIALLFIFKLHVSLIPHVLDHRFAQFVLVQVGYFIIFTFSSMLISLYLIIRFL